MIEVEKRFALDNPEMEKKILEGATFVAQEKHMDAYYDNDAYVLTTADRWLRTRDGQWELKEPLIPMAQRAPTFGSEYHEITDTTELRSLLHLAKRGTLAEDIRRAGYHPLCTFTTNRDKYIRDGLTIVIDIVSFGFRLAEVELMVHDASESDAAHARIRAFIDTLGIPLKPVGGKMSEWFKRNNPAHYNTLQSLGVFSYR